VTAFRPPPGFIPVSSSVDGIAVWGPAPVDDAVPDAPIDAKCPNCGAATAFDPQAGALTCTACGTVVGEKARRVGATGGAAEFTLEALRQATHGWGTERRVLRCGPCGAELSVAPNALATTCPFCASNKVELIAGDENALRPQLVIPFAITGNELEKRVKEFLGKGWMHPGELVQLARVDRFAGLYLPYWLFDASVSADWEAEVGTDSTETYRDDDGNTQTRTVTHWQWKKGHVDTTFTGVRIPGQQRLSAILIARIHDHFELPGLCAYDPGLLAGFQAQGYDIPLPDAWISGKAAIRELTDRACTSDADGDHVRNLSMQVAMHDETWRYAMLPVWVSTYRYGGRTWQVMVNGQTGDVEGQKPVVWWRIWAVMAVALVPGVCSGVVSLPLMLLPPVGIILAIVALVCLLLGGIGGYLLYQFATQAEAA
jgi:Zn finger protein HypA/HybF involved in hydrogenase expression